MGQKAPGDFPVEGSGGNYIDRSMRTTQLQLLRLQQQCMGPYHWVINLIMGSKYGSIRRYLRGVCVPTPRWPCRPAICLKEAGRTKDIRDLAFAPVVWFVAEDAQKIRTATSGLILLDLLRVLHAAHRLGILETVPLGRRV
jgi:hypothetical protein